MAQIIKHRRGTLAELNEVTLANGEIGIVTGSVTIGDAPIRSAIVVGNTDGTNRLSLARLVQGSGSATLAGKTGGANWNDMIYYDTNDYKLQTLHSTNGVVTLNLTGNISATEIAGNISGSATSTGSFGYLNVAGDGVIGGNLTFGDANTDNVSFGADVSSSLIPNNDDAFDLGSSGQQWKDLYIDGVAYIDTIGSDGDPTTSAYIAGGEIDGTVIGSETPAAGDFSAIGAAAPGTIVGTTIDATTDFTVDGLVISADDITNDAALEIQTAAGDIVLDPGGNNVLPGSDAADDLGAAGTQWKDLYVHGIGYIDQLGTDADPVAAYISSGELDGVTIGGESTAAITGTTIDATTDFTIGSTVITDDSIVMTPTPDDTITFNGATNGALSIVTVDTAAAAANITITADGTVDINSAGLMTLDSGGNIALEPAGGSHIKLDDVIQVDSGVVTGATSITSTAFVGTLDGVVGGNTPAAGTFTTLSATGNATITGDLTVNGTTTTLATTNLAVGDAFIFAATGSATANVDAGLIVQSGSAVDSGSAIYHDINSERWAVAKGVGSDWTAVTPKQMVVTTVVSASSPHSSYGEYGVGEMWLETDSQDIWIRTA